MEAEAVLMHFRHMYAEGVLQKQIAELNAFIEEERDFWDWLEDELGETRKELFDKYQNSLTPPPEDKDSK